MRLPIKRCEAILTQDLGPRTEDGEQTLVTVWDIVAYTTDGRRWLWPFTKNTKKAALAFVHRVLEHGSIDLQPWQDITV